MKQWLEEVKRNIQRFMIGRYGADEFSQFLIRATLVLIVLSLIPKLQVLSTVAWVLIIYSMFRTLSKNIYARSREREWFLNKTAKLRNRFNIYKRMWAERKTHRYFKCPSCKTFVRVPKGRGNIEITCTKCRNKMIRKS